MTFQSYFADRASDQPRGGDLHHHSTADCTEGYSDTMTSNAGPQSPDEVAAMIAKVGAEARAATDPERHSKYGEKPQQLHRLPLRSLTKPGIAAGR